MKPEQIDVELRGGPLDGERLTMPRALQYWAAVGDKWAVYIMRDECHSVLHYQGMIREADDE